MRRVKSWWWLPATFLVRGALRGSLLLVSLLLATQTMAVTRAELARAQEQITQAKQHVAKTRGKLDRSQAQLRDAEKSVAGVGAQLRVVQERERLLAKQLARLEAEQNTLSRQSAAQAKIIARDVRDAWLLSRQQQLRLWLAAESPTRAARIARYYHYLSIDRAARIAAWQQERDKLQALRDKIVAEREVLGKTRNELAGHQQALRVAGEARRKAVAQLAGELRSQNDTLKRLQGDEAALRKLFGTVREAYRDVPPEMVGAPFRQRQGKLRWPAGGKISAAFGSALAGGKLRRHGIILGAPEGSEVRAIHQGRVVYADWLRGFGLLTILDHGDGYLSVYGHNQSLIRASGDWVKEGDVIATVGVSGGQELPGLYFEIRVAGAPVDPARWLRR